MDEFRYNDDELLYLIKENSDEAAFEELYNKYRPLIVSRLKKFKIQDNNYDDYFEECLITLSECVVKYDKEKGKTFNKYFDMCCVYKIRNLLRSERKYFYNVILADYDEIEKYNYTKNERDGLNILNEVGFLTTFSKLEKDVYNLSKTGKTIKEISNELSKSVRCIYNTFSRIRKKSEKTPIIKTKNSTIDFWEDTSYLSKTEKKVAMLYAKGFKPSEIAIETSLTKEQVYNALKRATNKQNKLK